MIWFIINHLYHYCYLKLFGGDVMKTFCIKLTNEKIIDDIFDIDPTVKIFDKVVAIIMVDEINSDVEIMMNTLALLLPDYILFYGKNGECIHDEYDFYLIRNDISNNADYNPITVWSDSFDEDDLNIYLDFNENVDAIFIIHSDCNTSEYKKILDSTIKTLQ